MKIAVGSKNPVKIRAVKVALAKVWPENKVIGFDAPSRVSEQPKTENEAIRGAKNRAKFCLENYQVDIAVGIEGFTVESDHGMFVSAWVAVLDNNNNNTIGLGNAGRFLLPKNISAKIRAGGELGPLMDQFFGDTNLKQKSGAVGVFTNGIVNRDSMLERGVILALTKFMNPDYYK
ncbi:MAG: Non-canonical purine NTP phosphatase [Candidatus Woesearchaeota archaeon]|nr:Non-canonical purine NTP phosphatase [Candidatus Woesearchaeota archaeon]